MSQLLTNPEDMALLNSEPFSEALAQFHRLINNRSALAFLIGAGCSKCAGLPLTKELTDKILAHTDLDCISKKVLSDVKTEFAEAADAHIEDYLSEIVDLLAITDRRTERGITENTVSICDTKYSAYQLRRASDQIKRAIANAISKKVNISLHRDFVASVHQPIRVGRANPAQPVDYLVLNYDTIIEDALGLERIHYTDGLHGGATGWWNPSNFDTSRGDGLSARVIKLHGSIDWRQLPDDSGPRRVNPSIEIQDSDDLPVLIWPSSTKYREAQLDPFAQLLEQARKAIRPTNGSQRLLVICGYSFGDSHINFEIDKALHESYGNLTVAAFADVSEPTGQLKKWQEDSAIREQVLIFANGGFFHGDTQETSKVTLPWWKFENLVKIIKGEI